MEYAHIGQVVNEKIKAYADQVALRYKEGDDWVSMTYAQMGNKIQALTSALVGHGVQRGDRVGIYSANRYEWAITDFACILVGAISVPIYSTNTQEQAAYIIKDADVRIVFTGDETQYQNLADLGNHGPYLVSYGKIPMDPNKGCTFNEFLHPQVSQELGEELARRQEQIKEEDIFTIIYTSGTTGNPKGVMLTHGNIFHQFAVLDKYFSVTHKDTSLCFLPLSHVFERMWSYYVYMKGAIHTYLEDPKKVIETLQEVRPTAMVSVPRLYEKIHAAVVNAQEGASPVKRFLFRRAIGTGVDYHACIKAGKTPSLGLKLRFALMDKLVLSKIRDIVGGNKNFFAAGGAPLEQSIEEFFFACGLLICQGYGLTETSPMISCNTPGCFKFGTVGKPVPNCQVKLAENGEVWVRGGQVMKGYYNNPEKTAEDLVDGWFKTGDIGEFDGEGFLKITDRIKELIITSGGKNIAPQRIETTVGKDFFIEQIIAVGDRRQFISALIVPAMEALENWAKEQGLSYSSLEELVSLPRVKAFFRERIDLHSASLARYETIKKFRLLASPFTVEGNEITPTLKLKRKQITQKYGELISSMY